MQSLSFREVRLVCHSERSEESPTANGNRSFAYAQDDRLDGLCISPVRAPRRFAYRSAIWYTSYVKWFGTSSRLEVDRLSDLSLALVDSSPWTSRYTLFLEKRAMSFADKTLTCRDCGMA